MRCGHPPRAHRGSCRAVRRASAWRHLPHARTNAPPHARHVRTTLRERRADGLGDVLRRGSRRPRRAAPSPSPAAVTASARPPCGSHQSVRRHDEPRRHGQYRRLALTRALCALPPTGVFAETSAGWMVDDDFRSGPAGYGRHRAGRAAGAAPRLEVQQQRPGAGCPFDGDAAPRRQPAREPRRHHGAGEQRRRQHHQDGTRDSNAAPRLAGEQRRAARPPRATRVPRRQVPTVRSTSLRTVLHRPAHASCGRSRRRCRWHS